MHIDIYSDIACPWCAIGKQRFERALAAYDGADQVEAVYRPFQLDPGASSKGVPELEHLQRKFGPNATAMTGRIGKVATMEGFPINWTTTIAANTLDAHRLLWLAKREASDAVQRDLVGRLFAAHFQNGVNVGDRAALTTIAAEAGLDRERVAAFLASDEGTAEVRREIDEAVRNGIDSVPTYVFDGRWAVSGAQEASAFLNVFEQVAAETAADDAADTADADCADGSCVIPRHTA